MSCSMHEHFILVRMLLSNDCCWPFCLFSSLHSQLDLLLAPIKPMIGSEHLPISAVTALQHPTQVSIRLSNAHQMQTSSESFG
jgi:hypothetical protein